MVAHATIPADVTLLVPPEIVTLFTQFSIITVPLAYCLASATIPAAPPVLF